jgi:hypothetical protein
MSEYASITPATNGLNFPPELDAKIEDLAKLEGISKSDLLAKAFQNYLEESYRAMAEDREYQIEADEWVNAHLGLDVPNE